MKIKELFEGFSDIRWGHHGEEVVAGLESDSRRVGEGFVFVAIRGERFDGHDALSEVVAKKPLALVVEDLSKVPKGYKGTCLQVTSSRKALDLLADRFNGRPSSQLFCVGVTGTNGKTTVTHMIESLLNDSGRKTGVMGTIDHHIGEKKWETHLTTPDSLALHRRLAEFIQEGGKAAALEVSSHAIEQARADSVQIDVAVFTNLTRDHLDYHKDMESYFKAKERLFTKILKSSPKPNRWAIVNIDDEWGQRIKPAPGIQFWSFGKSKEADFRYRILSASFEGITAQVSTPKGQMDLKLPMVGEYNLLNALAAMAVAIAAGMELPQIQLALSNFGGVPGRLERAGAKKPYVFIDYAHTPDALENVLSSLLEVRKQSQSKSRIHCVFGCGGDRDTGKRPLMGAVASQFADEVWVTSDNPRSESPEDIIDEILHGITDPGENIHIITDRQEAIVKCISQAHCDDVILIAGKGHEDYQIIGDQRRPFSDLAIARKALDEKTV